MKHSGIFKLFLVMAMAGVVLHLAMATTWAGGTIYCYQRVLKSVPAHYLDVQYEWTACAAGSFAPNSCIKCVLYKSEADKSGRVVLDTQEGAFKKTWGTGTKGNRRKLHRTDPQHPRLCRQHRRLRRSEQVVHDDAEIGLQKSSVGPSQGCSKEPHARQARDRISFHRINLRPSIKDDIKAARKIGARRNSKLFQAVQKGPGARHLNLEEGGVHFRTSHRRRAKETPQMGLFRQPQIYSQRFRRRYDFTSA